MKYDIVLVLLLAAAPVAAPLAGQAPAPPDTAARDTFALPELVVTATRVPTRRDALPTPVTVLTGRELRERGIATVADALRAVPGATVVRAGPAGAQTSVFRRGGESDYVKVLVDGVPVNEPGGAIDLADLTTDQVERIEVVRGPASVLYGSDAVTGVIQIFTRRGAGAPALSAEVTGGRGERRFDDGTHATYDVTATVTGAAGPVGYAVGGGRSFSEGTYPFNNERTLNTANARLGWAGDRSDIAVATRLSDGRYHFPTDGAGQLTDRNAFLDRRSSTTSLEAAHRVHDRVTARLQLGLVDRAQRSIDRQDDEADTLGVYASRLDTDMLRRHADLRVDLDLPRGVFTGGLALEDARARTRYASDSEWGPSTAASDERRGSRGTYVQLLTEPVRGLDLSAGTRLDDNDAFGTFHTWRLGASWRLATGTRLRGALGRAFREPTFGESYGSGFGDAGNPDLVPERSDSREVGVEQRLPGGVALVAITAFDQRFHDLIQYTFATEEPGDPNYFNVGAARARGVELSAEVALGRTSLGGAWTWLETEVLDPGLATDASFVEGEPLLRRPARSAALTARHRLRDGSLGVTINHIGEREDVDYGAGFPAPRVTLDPYTTIDIAVEHAVPIPGPDVALLLRVHNLTDARYVGIAGFPAPGRAVRLGLRLGAGGR